MPTDTVLPDPAALKNDPLMKPCVGPPFGSSPDDQMQPLTAYRLPHASDYRSRLPMLEFDAYLATHSEPALVVPLVGWDESSEKHIAQHHSHNVCIASGQYMHLFLSVDVVWPYLSGEQAPPPSPYTTRVMASLPGLYSEDSNTNLIWDRSRGVVWWAHVKCNILAANENASAVFSWNPATGSLLHWAIPDDASETCQQHRQAALDSSGAVWILETATVLRFDPATHTVRSVPIGAEYASALATDGATALVRRPNSASLLRIDAQLNISTLPLGDPLSKDYTAMAVSGRYLYALSDDPDRPYQPQLHVVPLAGGPAIVRDVSGARLDVTPDGAVILWQTSGLGGVVSETGSLRPATLMGALCPGVNPEGAVTDWVSRTWFLAQLPNLPETDDQSVGRQTLIVEVAKH